MVRAGGPGRSGRSGGPILALDTATSTAVVALGDAGGSGIVEDRWRAGYRHGEELLARIDALLARAGVRLDDVAGIVAGTGPGAFTGLRVGLATAKGIAHGLGRPLVGVSTGEALIDAASAAAGRAIPAAPPGSPGESASMVARSAVATPPGASASFALLLPAGPSDRVLVHGGSIALLPAGTEPELPPGTTLVAVDLEGRAPPEATARGTRALEGLGSALLRIGAARLAAGDADDVALVVPEYVTLPRGVRDGGGEVAWSHGRR